MKTVDGKSMVIGFLAACLLILGFAGTRDSVNRSYNAKNNAVIAWWQGLTATQKTTAKLYMSPSTVDVVWPNATANQKKWLKASIHIDRVCVSASSDRARKALEL